MRTIKKPLVSIITPTFNQEKYISTCIRSVINQTYKKWEMIILDDASIDNTFKIALNFSKQDKRIKIIKHQENWGIKKLKDTYNQALKFSKGQFIAILEGDDFWPEDKLETQIKVFNDKNVVLSYGKWAMTNQEGKIIYIRNFDKLTRSLDNKNSQSIFNLFLTLQFDIGSQTVIIRKKPLSEIGGFHDDLFFPFIDLPTYLRLALKGKFVYLPMLLGYYRRTKNSSWFNFASKSHSMGKESVKNCINNFIKNNAKVFSKTVDWKKIEKNQHQYLIKRKILLPASIFFNKFLAQGKFFL
jgi:glycosyltransferase involved in cell wall biosynthesis